jgi:hypothetical protein
MVLYNLVYDGKVQEGLGVARVKQNLTSLFKIDPRKVERLFTGKPMVIKKGVDYDTAMKYQHALRRAGAICAVEQTAAQSPAPPPPPAATPEEADAAAERQPLEARVENGKKRIEGLGDILGGSALIGIGLVMGGSVLLGNPGWLDYIFDSLGVSWIGYGIFKLVRSQRARQS